MNVSRHISIDDEYNDKIKPYVEKHKGNFNDALIEIINNAGNSRASRNSSAIDIPLLNWMLEEVHDLLVPDNILDELIDPALINSLEKLEEYVNCKFSEPGWGINLNLKCDNDTFPSCVLIELRGSSQKIRFVGRILSQYLVKNSLNRAPLGVKSVINSDEYMNIELSGSNKKNAIGSLNTFFGGMDEVIKTIKNRPSFWKSIINWHILSNYNMITIHRNCFEDLIAEKAPMGEVTIETLAKKPIREIPLDEMLFMVKQVYESCRIVDRIDIENDSMIAFHSYRDKETIEKIKKIFVMLLEANGHVYEAKSTANMIVLRHRPDVGSKINEIVDRLKTSNSRLDKELIMLVTFLKGLREIPDIPLSLSVLGRRIGKSLMQEYETENNIKTWDNEQFRNALEIIDSRLKRVSELKLEGKDLVYTIRKCNIATEGNNYDNNICHCVRETFKGALNYAFGNKAELSVNKLLSRGDHFCEVLIRLP